MLKKILSVILSVSLIAASAGVEVFAAKSSKNIGNVLFSYDFEKYEEGALITADKSNIADLTQVTSKEGATVLSAIKDKKRGTYMQFESITTDGAYSGPKISKTINLGALTNLHIEYEFMGDASTTCSITDGGASISALSGTEPSWVKGEIDINVTKGTYESSVNGGKVSSGSINDFTSFNNVTISIVASLRSGMKNCLDNIIFSTTDDITPAEAFSQSTPINPKNEKLAKAVADKLNVTFDTSVPKKVEIPSGMNPVVYDDCESYGAVLTYDNWTLTGNKSYINPEKISGNQVFKVSNDTPEMHGPRFSRSMKDMKLDTFYFECDAMANPAAKMSVALMTSAKSVNIAYLDTANCDAKWHHLKSEVSFKNKTCDFYVDGAKVKTLDMSALYADDMWKTMELRMNVTANPGALAYIDNTVGYTPDEITGTVFDFQGNINWDAVKTDNPTGMVAKIRESHPRLYTNNWDTVREKIKNDYWCKVWWDSLKAATDAYAESPDLIEYKLNERNNLNNTSTAILIQSICLSFVGGVTGDRKYSDKLYQILKHAHDTWPDYGESTALISANVIQSFALAYDWLYDVFTPEQREDVLKMTMDRAAYIAVEGYENRLSEAYHTMLQSATNQTMGSNMANTMLALSIATDYPDVAEYLLSNISKGMPNSFVEIYPDGAYIETCEYWNYGVLSLLQTIAVLESSIKDGESLPECLDWADTPGLINTGDFPIYYNGAKKSFNYGDSSDSFISSIGYMFLSTRYKKPKYAWYEINTTQVNTPFTTRRNPFAIIWYEPEYAVCKPGEFELDKFYSSTDKKSVNGMSVRSSWENKDMFFGAMQGGDNSSMHMEPSLGTFVLDYGGERWFLLTGKNSKSGTYTISSKYDGPASDLWHKRTESNNTLVINPDMTVGQNKDALAIMTKFDSDANSAYGILDVSQARDDISSWRRGMMMFDKRNRIKIRDEITMKEPSEIYWYGHTDAAIEILPDKKSAMMTKNGKTLYVRLNDAPDGATLDFKKREPLPTSPNPEIQWDEYQPEHSGDKTLFVHLTNTTTANIELEFVPIRDGEAIPTDTATKENLDSWKCEGGRAFVEQEIGNAVALKIDSPLTFAKGKKSYVDADNKDVVPFIENDRTLVPVRFISESFGAKVGWDDATKTVDVQYLDKHITLQLGSAEMNVNGAITTLDVCANVYNDRTFIPLRALSEALGKVVTWDSRGLIIISDADMGYGEEALSDACKYLDIRVFAGDDEIEFSPSKTVYYVSGAKRDITFTSNHFTGSIEKKGDDVIVIDGTEYKFIFEN